MNLTDVIPMDFCPFCEGLVRAIDWGEAEKCPRCTLKLIEEGWKISEQAK